jgi:hypothetical protein
LAPAASASTNHVAPQADACINMAHAIITPNPHQLPPFRMA